MRSTFLTVVIAVSLLGMPVQGQTLTAHDRLGPGYDALVADARANGMACEIELSAGPWGRRCEAFRSALFSVNARHESVLHFCKADLEAYMNANGGSDGGYPDSAGCDEARARLGAQSAVWDRVVALRRVRDPDFARALDAGLTARNP